MENWKRAFLPVLVVVCILGWTPSFINAATDPSDGESSLSHLPLFDGFYISGVLLLLFRFKRFACANLYLNLHFFVAF